MQEYARPAPPPWRDPEPTPETQVEGWILGVGEGLHPVVVEATRVVDGSWVVPAGLDGCGVWNERGEVVGLVGSCWEVDSDSYRMFRRQRSSVGGMRCGLGWLCTNVGFRDLVNEVFVPYFWGKHQGFADQMDPWAVFLIYCGGGSGGLDAMPVLGGWKGSCSLDDEPDEDEEMMHAGPFWEYR